MAEYEIEIHRLPGEENFVADYLRRSIRVKGHTEEGEDVDISKFLGDESMKYGSFVAISREGEDDREKMDLTNYEPGLAEVKQYLTSFNGASAPKRLPLRGKNIVVIRNMLMCRAKKGWRVVPAIQDCKGILQTMHA